ncbi:MAG: PLP-dependent aminotransferase family protein [Candidatus Dormibacter sp.]|uniref:MocR-like pyridoxine biosynthesis transcription factor PdxR n=1 Tax=Candidatus Dormibacter sp. TaxID=2973982 RepID=UPI000DB17562|nr:MAG: GntR family transcriptional regulator [Candidatus Dormibacteraeota bacterium]
MPQTWATLAPDLYLELRGTRRRAGLEQALREAVRSGRLGAGTALPSSRALAQELGLARNTVADAYGQLIAEGWLSARQGSGTRVADRATPAEPAAGVSRPSSARRRSAYDLLPGTPDLASFPRSLWLGAARKALAAARNEEFGYQDPRGLLRLRERLAQYLARVRGVRTTAERIIVCSGFAQALHLLATTLNGQGARVFAVESYGIGLHRDIIRAAGVRTPPLAIDSSGAVIDQLRGLGAGAVLLTPGHQFPLGVSLTAQRRVAALEWARGSGGLVVEDDYDGEFRYDRPPLGALQSLAPDVVAYVGTASKSLAPGLSLAWLVAPSKLVDALVESKRSSGARTGVLEQLTMEEFIRSGAYDRHIRRSRLLYRQRRDLLVARLTERSPGVSVTGMAAGLHAVLALGSGLRGRDEPGIRTRAHRAGLAVQGLAEFRHDPDPEAPAALVVGYGTPPDHAFAGAVEALCDVLG